jgi:hypothetical protein
VKSEWPPVETAIRANRLRIATQGRPRREDDEMEEGTAD